MPSRATIEDVAKEAGVSVATVSRALRDLPNVAVSTRARVLKVATELSYVADPTASRLAVGRTGTIAVAVPLFDSWYFSTVVAGIEALAKDNSVDLLLYAVGDEGERQRFLAGRGAWWRRGDALVMVDIRLTEAEAKRLADQGASIVTIGSKTDAFPSITIDEHEAARTAITHLTDLGHRKIGLITGNAHALDFRVPIARIEGALDGLADAGISSPVGTFSGDFDVQGGREAMAKLLDLNEPPTAVFSLSDEMAYGALAEMRFRGLRPGSDVSIIGFDNHQLAEIAGLTTIAQNPDKIGATAGRLVLEAMHAKGAELGFTQPEGGGEPDHVRAETALIVRNTTGPLIAGAVG